MFLAVSYVMDKRSVGAQCDTKPSYPQPLKTVIRRQNFKPQEYQENDCLTC